MRRWLKRWKSQPIIQHLEEMEKRIMSAAAQAIQTLNTKLDGLKSVLDNQTTSLATLKTDLQALADQGGASVADINALITKVDTITGEAQNNLAAVAALDPGPPSAAAIAAAGDAPAPAPAPADPAPAPAATNDPAPSDPAPTV